MKYKANAEHRSKLQKAARVSYRKKNPRITDIDKGLRVPPEKLEVLRIGDEEFVEGIVQVKCYTLSSMALALGKTRMTLRTWVKTGVIPPPVLRDENNDRFKYYSFGEVKIMNRVLNQHFKEFDYLATSHETTIHQMWQEIEGYRREYI